MAFGATAARAQQGADDAAAQDTELEEVIVTGSLITANPNLTRSAPVAVIEPEEMEFQGTLVAEEILREIPGVVPSIGQQVNNGNSGFSHVNLRGLGSNRNIVLIDGVRVVPSDLESIFDLNNIPLALVERIDVLTGGASTTYGADALGGVTNFITRKNFTGVEVNAGLGTTAEGDGDSKRVEVILGAGLDDDRGNVVMSIAYQKTDEVLQGSRDFSDTVNFYWNGNIGGSGLGSFNTRFGNVNPTGQDNANLTLGAVQPDDDGFAAAFTPFNYAPFNSFQTPFERYNVYAAGHYEITAGIEAYTRALFSRNTVTTLIAPSGSFGDTVVVSLNHPFLSDAQRNAFCAFDTDSAAGVYTPRFTQAECDAAGAAQDPSDPNYREVTTQLRRRNVEGGPRISDFVADYFDYQLGLRGNISDSINFDALVSYGQSSQVQTQKGYWLKSRFRNALRAGPNGCFADLASGCIPADYFGYTGAITEEMNAYLAGGESAITTKYDMLQVKGVIGGELDMVQAPWASDPVSFAVAGEYRDYTASRASDLLSQSGDLGGAGGASPNINGGYSVYEGVAEVLVPVVQDMEFAEQLNLEAGVRYSDYQVDAPEDPSYTTTTWKFGASWTPINDITLRGTFSRAVRAPNIEELFEPQTTLLDNLSVDPCASVNDQGVNSGFVPTGALRDVCIAQGAPVGAIGNIPQPAAGQVNYTTGGNLELVPEDSDSWTVGVILQPQLVPGLTVTVDYYDIKIDSSIEQPASQDAINACFENPSTSNAACTSIVRSPIDGSLSGDEAVVKGLPRFRSNTGNLRTRGIDFTASYGYDLSDEFRWSSRLVGNWTDISTFQAVTGISLNRDCVALYSSSCESIQPRFASNWRNTITWRGDLDVSLNWRYISRNKYENRATDEAFSGTPEGQGRSWDFNVTDAYHLFDLSLRYQVLENLSVTGVVSNLFDKHPPLTGAFIGATGYNSGNTYPSTFDTLGRRFSINARLSF